MPNDIIEVTEYNLRTWRAALNSALMHNTVLDLAESYRKLSARPQSSPMTKALQTAVDEIDQIFAYLEEAEVEAQPDE